MKKIFTAILIVAFSACKKDQVETPEPEKKPNTETSVEQPDDSDLLEASTRVLNLDLNSINFTPSANPVSFFSTAVGRPDNSGNPSQVRLGSAGWTHPCVLRLREKWNGYTYWAAITPYPNADSQYENPHIFCSNDGKTWIEPVGIFNPIEPVPLAAGYNSDVNLLMLDNVLYCYWRRCTNERSLLVSTSSDGVKWSTKKLICSWPTTGMDVIAPSVIKDNNLYYCYGICNSEPEPGSYYKSICVRRMVSDSPTEGFVPDRKKGYDVVNITNRPWGTDQDPWHLEVKKVMNIWLMLITTTNHGGYGSGGRLFLGYSMDGQNFTFGDRPLCSSTSTYKSSIHAKFDKRSNSLSVEMWRAMMSGGWAVYYDRFNIKMQYSPSI